MPRGRLALTPAAWADTGEVLPGLDEVADLHYLDLPASAAAPGTAPLLLLHGFAGSVADWDAVAPALAADRRVVAYDHRGHGGSGKSGDRSAYTFDLLDADLESFAARVLPGPVDLVGHSMGGVVALRYALAHPERVRSLVLVSTAPKPAAAPFVRLLFKALNVVVARKGLDPLLRLVQRLVKVPDGATPEERARLERQGAALAAMDPAAFVALSRGIRTYPSLRGRLADVTCPVLVLNGARDTGLRRSARTFLRRMPHAELAVIRGAGHNPQTERADAWLEAVREHLTRDPTKPPTEQPTSSP
ncbi:alpha/beta fold hydrolase [Yinghuangia seranimata]|uniref:alpha/beta fold hydrolase n=1 Tax=Yinghuangia seranimata TaxID=408067 RepID=UPI00248D28F0|nr:alpha/beta fold hydrolase [Yinghuangia seranimata]MDI2129624.1 alpha/beta fold hydrolase [Yinghuangia seranimata]